MRRLERQTDWEVSCSSGSVHTSLAELSKSSMEAVRHQPSTSHVSYHKAQCSVRVCLYCTRRILKTTSTRSPTTRNHCRTLASRRDVCHIATRELHQGSQPLDVCQPSQAERGQNRAVLGLVTSGSGSAVEYWSVLAAWNWNGHGEWPSPCRWHDADVGPVSRQARCQHLCDVLLLASPTQTSPMFTWCWVSGYVGPRFCDVTRGLLQRHSCWGIQVYRRQAPASTECCRLHHQRHTEVRPRTEPSPAQRVALAGHYSVGAVQAVCNSLSMSAAQSTTVHDGPQILLVGSICCPTAVISCLYHDTGILTFSHRAFSVAGPAAWNSLPDYL